MLKIWKSIFVIILLSALGAGLWLYEIVKVIIWNNLAWVHERLYSAFLGSFLAACSFLAPFFIEKQLSFKNAVISVTILTVTNVACYGQGKELCYDANSYLYLMEVRLDLIMKLVLHAIGLYIFIGIVYWLITNLFIKKNKKKFCFNNSLTFTGYAIKFCHHSNQSRLWSWKPPGSM